MHTPYGVQERIRNPIEPRAVGPQWIHGCGFPCPGPLTPQRSATLLAYRADPEAIATIIGLTTTGRLHQASLDRVSHERTKGKQSESPTPAPAPAPATPTPPASYSRLLPPTTPYVLTTRLTNPNFLAVGGDYAILVWCGLTSGRTSISRYWLYRCQLFFFLRRRLDRFFPGLLSFFLYPHDQRLPRSPFVRRHPFDLSRASVHTTRPSL